MGRGLIGGALWGVVVAGFGLIVVSQVAPPPKPGATGPAVAVVADTTPPVTSPAQGSVVPEDQIAQAQIPAPVDAGSGAAAPAAAVPAAQPPAEAEIAAAPAVSDTGKVATTDAATAALPAAKAASQPPKLPASPEVMAALAPPEGVPALPTTAVAPAVAKAPDATLAPAAPDAPSAASTAAPQVPQIAATPADVALPTASDAAPVVQTANAALAQGAYKPTVILPAAQPPAADAAPQTGILPPPAAETEPALVTGSGGPILGADAAPVAEPAEAVLAEGDGGATAAGNPPPPAVGVIEVPEASGAEPALPAELQVAEGTDRQATDARPSLLKKPKPFKSASHIGVRDNRTKNPVAARIDTADAVPEAVPETGAVAAAGAPTVSGPDDSAPPIERFARPFDNVGAKPVFAIVLIDTGEQSLDRIALAELPFPVTFALDPAAPGATLAATIYRASGQEVVMLATGIPGGAKASDIEVTFASNDAALPEAVAVLDLETGGFQANRELTTLIVPVVAGQGRGLLSWDRGLNAASQVARREGLRSGVIFRRLDGEGEPKAQIRRYLDRAAFKAAQNGRVIVAGETRPETVAALLEWAVEGRAATVALAPLTAALRVE